MQSSAKSLETWWKINMEEVLLGLHRQISEAIVTGSRFRSAKPKNITKILFCGMGGSAISGDILRAVVTESTALPFKVNRSGQLSNWVDRNTLVILSSYSGNSIEILNMVPSLLKSRASILVVSSGGKLSEIAAKKKLPCLKITGGLMPRCAIGYTTFSLLPVLKYWGWADYSDADIKEVIAMVKKAPRAEARALAKQLYGKFAHFYGSAQFSGPILTRWRCQLAENSKMLASQHLIPEMMHNEIEGWKFPKDILKKSAAVFFYDKNDPKWLLGKIEGAQAIIRKSGASVHKIHSRGKSKLARLFSLISLGDWTSYELAVLNHIDPMAIPHIETLKKIK